MEASPAEEVIVTGSLEIHPAEGLTLAAGRPIALSVREFDLLVALARRTGRIVARGALFAEVWGAELRPGDRSVDVYVRKLRVKLEQALPDWRFIHTHIGFGYRLAPEAAEPPDTASHAFHITATGR